MATQKKIDIVKEINEKLSKAKSLVFADYRGLTVHQIQDLKKLIKKEKGELVVTKNTLLKRALSETGFPSLDDTILEGPTATLFSYEDEIAPLKALATFAKASGIPQLKAGILEKVILGKERLEELALLPPKNVLIAKLIGTIASPTYGLVTVLSGNMRKLVYALEAIKNSKS